MKGPAAVVMTLALASTLPVMSQQLKPNELPTNIPGATTIAAPQQGFDPLTASDEDLAYNGFPPRPDQAASPKAFASWVKAMNASKIRVVPNLNQTNRYSGPAKINKNASLSSDDAGALESFNWSGYVNLSGGSSYGSASFYYVLADFLVPVARQPFGVCTGDWDYSVSWVGIDGWNSNDVLQAGFEDDAYCSGSTTATFYSPWYEWYPNNWTNITNLPIAPGDELFVVVWSTSATQGYAYMVNENTDQAVAIGFTAPAGTKLVGNSAEWIVERPTIGGSLATMTNYVDDPFWDGYAVTFCDSVVDPSSSTSNPITGLDNSAKADSYPTLLGPAAFLVQTEGSAR
jgi:Peptidase A4 family